MHSQIIKIRSKILVYLTHNMALPFLKYFRKPILFPYSNYDLEILPKGTLGNDLHIFLQSRKLQLLPYYAKHDLKHILLEYDTTDKGEVCLQCFMLGNRHISFPVVATVIYGAITMPEYWKSFLLAFKRGKKGNTIHNWNWFSLIEQNTILLKQKINTPINENNC